MLNAFLDRRIRPEIVLFGRARSAFQVLSYLGGALGVLLMVALAFVLGLSLWVTGVLILAAVLALVARLAISGIFPNYHLQFTVVGVAAASLWIWGQPVLPYLDVTVLGLGVAIVFGRIGCLMVGCCHGRPARWGVCYGDEHAATGFTRYYVGSRLFPIQAVECLWVLVIVCIGVGALVAGRQPGTIVAWYASTYAVGRFGIAFLRGDPRTFYAGFFETQWLSVLVVIAVAGVGAAGVLPMHPAHVAAAAGIVLVMIGVAVHRRLRRDARHRLLNPAHVREVAEAVALLTDPAGTDAPATTSAHRVVRVASTSTGLRLSTGLVETAEGPLRHYTLSAADGTLSEADARTLADLLVLLQHHDAPGEVLPGSEGIFHLLVRPPKRSQLAFSQPIEVA